VQPAARILYGTEEDVLKSRTTVRRFSIFLAAFVSLPLTSIAQTAPPLAVTEYHSDPDKEIAFQWLDTNNEAIRKVSLNIWNSPEIALHEYKSSRELMAYLETNGFRVEKGVAGMPTAFVASYGSGKPVIALYGEYDALAGLSQKPDTTAAPIKEGAPGHGCGHNLIGAGSAGAAVAVSKLMAAGKIKGTLRFYGTPAEESIGGKAFMLEAGLFNDVDVLLGWHPQDSTRASFQFSKAVVSVRFKFKGVAAHASSAPQLGRSALKGVELMDVGVNFAREHLKEDARIHSVITNGGGQPNVVPAQAESWYYIRANKHEDVAEMVEWVSEIARGAAMMTRTQVEIVIDEDTYELLPNRPIAEVMDRNLRLVGPPRFSDEEKAAAKKMQEPLKKNIELPLAEIVEPLPETPGQGSFSTDMGNVSWSVPSQIFEVATFPYRTPIHSWQVAACSAMSNGQKGMLVAAKTLAATAIDMFKNPSMVEAAKNDLLERKKKHPFNLLTPPNRKPPVFPESQ
jgi:aminobenzoyl-glutamate utilization protein B